MKKNYEAPKAEKMEFNYSETVVASSVICGSGLTKVYKDTGKINCEDTYVETKETWKADTL